MTAKLKPLVALDLDGVLYRWTESAIDTFNELRGLDVPHYGEDKHWNNIRDYVSEDDWKWLWSDRSARRRCMGAGRSFADGIRAARELEKVARVVIMTSRPADCMDVTMNWLATYHLCPHAVVHIAMPQRKAEHEFLRHCEVLIDDNPDNCRDARDHSQDTFGKLRTVFCPARAYNEELEGELGIVRFDDWDTVLDWVREKLNAEEGPRG